MSLRWPRRNLLLGTRVAAIAAGATLPRERDALSRGYPGHPRLNDGAAARSQ